MQTEDQRNKVVKETEFFTEYGDANRYQIIEIIGKGSYGVVCAALDTHTGGKVAIKKITDIFQNISDAIRILREIKLLRLLRHPDIVEIKRIMLPPSKRDFKDIYVVFELMESDLHQVIKANDDLTREHQRFFLYQMLRAMKYMHTANVYHRDLKPKNILANANCKLKICDFGLARVAFNDTPSTVLWTDYVATRWYRAPELCGSFFSKYTPAIDIWSIGCIFAEVLRGKPLFPGRSIVHQLDLITDLLGTPSADTISGVRNEKARKYLMDMRKKSPVPLSEKFPNADPLALKLLQRLLEFDPKDRPTAEEALADPYFKGLSKIEREPSCQPVSKFEFEFERRKLTEEDIRDLIYREILEYHPTLLKEYISGTGGSNFIYPSAISHLKKQFAYLEENTGKSGPATPPERKHVSLPRSTVNSQPIPPQAPLNFLGSTISGNASKFLQPPSRAPTGRAGNTIRSYESSQSHNSRRPYFPNHQSPPLHHEFKANWGRNKYSSESGNDASQIRQSTSMSSTKGMNLETESISKPQRQYSPSTMNLGVSFEGNNYPYLPPQGKIGIFGVRRSFDAKAPQPKLVEVGAGGAVNPHQEVGAVHIGLT